MYRHVRVALMLVALAAGATGCGRDKPPAATRQVITVEAPGPFQEIDKETAKLVGTEATWQAPDELTVRRTERIGLAIGQGTALKSRIEQLLPAAAPTGAGRVLVGPTVRAWLHADPDDAVVTPSAAVDASTGSDVQILWTWLVQPKHPTDALLLTVQLEVPLSSGHTIHNEVALTLPVRRTASYTAGQVFAHWSTWSVMTASAASVATWAWRRRRRAGTSPAPATPERVTVP